MLTVQSAPPELALRPFVRAYVQREAHLGSHELVEPVVARLGVMLEFEFAGGAEDGVGGGGLGGGFGRSGHGYTAYTQCIRRIPILGKRKE